MKRILFYLYIGIPTTLLFVLLGCNLKRNTLSTTHIKNVSLKYAEHLSIKKDGMYTIVTLINPWHKEHILHTYILVNRNDSAKAIHLPKGTVVYTPIERSIVFTTAHCKLLEMLGVATSIVGVADAKYIHIPTIQERIKSKQIVDCGDAMAPLTEKMIVLHPQALLVSPFENSGGEYRKVESLGCPIIELADYMETSPLGRAEWMKFYGMLFGCEQRADSLFAIVDSSYQALKQHAWRMPQGASLLTERKMGSVWYVPGGKSTIGQMIVDAHGKYAFSNDTHSGSLPLSFEEVLEKAGNSNIWALKYNGDKPMRKNDLLAEYYGYSALSAFQHGVIYGCNTMLKPFYEETPFRPDYLLQDFMIMLHPKVSCFGKLRYYERID